MPRSAQQIADHAARLDRFAEPDHFRGVTKLVVVGSGAEREIDDIMMDRYACYLTAQNGDPKKRPIAFAQTYFAIQGIHTTTAHGLMAQLRSKYGWQAA